VPASPAVCMRSRSVPALNGIRVTPGRSPSPPVTSASATAAAVTAASMTSAPSGAASSAAASSAAEATKLAEAASSVPVRKPEARPPAEPPSSDGVRLKEWRRCYPVDWIGLVRRHVFGKIRAALRCGYVCWSVFRGSSADACQ
jgi:hypothetical protein